MRYVAWLNATLDPPKEQSKPSSKKRNEQPPITRKQKLTADGVELHFPPLWDEAYLLDILFDAGPVQPLGMGSAPLGYAEIKAWEHAQGVRLTPWEAGVLRRLSRAYLDTLHASTNPATAAPGSVEETPEDADERRKRVSEGLAAQLRMLRDTKPKR